MRIGVPLESLAGETRVAATPKTVEQLIGLGYAVFVQHGAGHRATFEDDAYAAAGADVVGEEVWNTDVILKINAPSTEELYSAGPHDATVTFDIGNADFKKETSRNIELTVQKTTGLVRWKANAFRNQVDNFIYGNVNGTLVDEEGNVDETSSIRQRVFEQAGATIQGAEAELTYNALGNGWSGRVFADTSKGRLDNAGSLPLQPADRLGASVAYKAGPWRAGASLVHGDGQERLASFETSTTPSYNMLGANISYTQKLAKQDITYFVLAKNLLNDDIRLSTSILKDVAPLPGRNFVIGVRTHF